MYLWDEIEEDVKAIIEPLAGHVRKAQGQRSDV
jgi:hypothetical protein